LKAETTEPIESQGANTAVPGTLFRSTPGRRAGSQGSASRRGAVVLATLSWLLCLGLGASPAWASPLEWRPEPDPLIAKSEGTTYFEARLQACTQDGGCLMTLPDSRLPEVLATPLRAHLPAAAARILLPAGSRWMLVSRGEAGPLVSANAILLRAPRVGDRPQAVSLPFDLVARADRLHVAGMFLIGIALLLGSSVLGFLIRHPAEPVIPGAEEPFIPETKILPRLVTSPAASGRSRP